MFLNVNYCLLSSENGLYLFGFREYMLIACKMYSSTGPLRRRRFIEIAKSRHYRVKRSPMCVGLYSVSIRTVKALKAHLEQEISHQCAT